MANGIETGTRPVNFRKVGIVGCGFVGSASAFALMQSGLFSEMVLIDVDRDRAEGEALDIAHGMPLASPANIYAGNYADIADAGVVIITAGANQKPGETRLDLVSKNVSIFKSIVPQITQSGFDGILLVVSNPVDVLTGYTLELSGFPAERVIGSGTVLDTARIKCLLGEKLGVDSRNVHAFMLGEHGDSEVAVWSSANISGADLDDFCLAAGIDDPESMLASLAREVTHAAYDIIERKGATCYGIAMAVRRIAEAIIRDEHAVLPVSTLARGAYGIEGVCLGLPAVVGRSGVSRVLDLPLSRDETERLLASAHKLKTLMEG